MLLASNLIVAFLKDDPGNVEKTKVNMQKTSVHNDNPIWQANFSEKVPQRWRCVPKAQKVICRKKVKMAHLRTKKVIK